MQGTQCPRLNVLDFLKASNIGSQEPNAKFTDNSGVEHDIMNSGSSHFLLDGSSIFNTLRDRESCGAAIVMEAVSKDIFGSKESVRSLKRPL